MTKYKQNIFKPPSPTPPPLPATERSVRNLEYISFFYLKPIKDIITLFLWASGLYPSGLLLFLINLTFRTNSTVSPIIGYPRVPGGKGLVVPSESHPYVMQINHKVLMSQGKDQYSRTLTSSACTYTLYNTLSKSNTCSFIAVKVNTNWRSTQYKHLSTTFFFRVHLK